MCDPCNVARLRMNKGAALDRHRGNPRSTTLGDEAWAIVNAWPRDQLHRVTGIRVDKIIRYDKGGPTMPVLRTTRDRILAAGRRPYWTPIGIQRRVMALGRLGWSMRAVAAETGLDADALKRLWKRDAMFVRANMAAGVIAAYEQLSMRPPPSGRSATRTRRAAEARGWASPMAWDCIDTDPAPRGIRTDDRRDLLTEWHELQAAGESIDQAARRLGVTVNAIEQAAFRATKKGAA